MQLNSDSIRTLPPIDLRQRYTIFEAAAYLRISRDYVYKLMRAGRLRTIRDGSRRYVPGTELARLSTLPDSAA